MTFVLDGGGGGMTGLPTTGDRTVFLQKQWFRVIIVYVLYGNVYNYALCQQVNSLVERIIRLLHAVFHGHNQKR